MVDSPDADRSSVPLERDLARRGARALMEELPLGRAGLMKHEFIELGPLTPLHLLLADDGAPNEDL